MTTSTLSKRPGLLIIAIAYSTFICLGLFDGLLGVAWPSMRATFDLPLDALGILLLAFTSGHIVASFSNGRFLQITGVATLLTLSLALRGAAFLTQALSPVWLLVVFIGFLSGVGAGMLDAGMNTFAAARFRPRLLNWLHASFGVGASLGSFMMTTLLGTGQSWRLGFGILAALTLLLSAVIGFTRDHWTLPQQEISADEPAPSHIRSRDTLKLPIVWISIVTFALYTGLELGLGQWSFTLATESRGLAQQPAGYWTTLYWGSLTAGRIILGFIETNTERLVRVALVVVVSGATLFALNLGPTISLAGLMLVGFGLAPVFPSLIALTPLRIGSDHASNAIGFQVGAAGIGAAVLPGLAGVLGDTFGVEVIAVFFAAAAVLLFVAQETAARNARQVQS
ncbi:MAG: MFS transporter [Candidatus Promineifilaceae bacterium]